MRQMLTWNFPSERYETLAMTSPPKPCLIASLTSNQPFSPQFTIPISPILRGVMNFALLPVAKRKSSSGSSVNRRLGLLTSVMLSSTGRSSDRYLRSTQNRRRATLASVHSDGEGPAMDPRVTLWMKPC